MLNGTKHLSSRIERFFVRLRRTRNDKLNAVTLNGAKHLSLSRVQRRDSSLRLRRARNDRVKPSTVSA